MKRRLAKIHHLIEQHGPVILKGRFDRGYCPVCRRSTLFLRKGEWLRDFYFCLWCESIPRQRALLEVLDEQYLDWPSFKIYECAPAGASSWAIQTRCKKYTSSHYWEDVKPGDSKNGTRCEDLEALTFADDSFDIVITQDVFEHVLRAERGFAEIARVLRPGGAHVFTVPIYPHDKTLLRAKPSDNGIQHIESPDYHGNPVDPNGSLVVREWSRDIVDFIAKHSPLKTTIYSGKDYKHGIDGEFLDVVVSRKSSEQ